jgi:hypothetical protein
LPYVPVPKDLTTVKTKVAFGLTKRQIVCFSLAGLIGLPIYFLFRGAIGNSAAVLVMIFIMLPFFVFATYERNGQPAEKVLKNYLLCRKRPEVRVYKTENIYKTLSQQEGGNKIAPKNQTAGKKTSSKHRAVKKGESRHPQR